MTKCIADDQKRLQEVAIDATEAFWRVVAEKYPEIKSGDVSPAAVFEFDDFVERAIKKWLVENQVD